MTALGEARKLHGRLTAAAAADKAKAAKFEALDQKLATISGYRERDPRVSVPVVPPSTTDLAFLTGSLRSLIRSIDGADGGPSPDARSGLDQTSAVLERTLADWTALRSDAEEALKAAPAR
jgi:hypothetical protein